MQYIIYLYYIEDLFEAILTSEDFFLFMSLIYSVVGSSPPLTLSTIVYLSLF